MITQGINFPLTIDPVRGNLVVASEADLIKGHILSWLQTETNERIMVPNYGRTDSLFTSISNINLITSEFKTGLEKYIPEAEFEVSGTINDQGEAVILVYWSYGELEQNPIKITI